MGAPSEAPTRAGIHPALEQKGEAMKTFRTTPSEPGSGEPGSAQRAGIRRVSRVEALRIGLERLGFVRDPYDRCSRRDRWVSRAGTESRELVPATSGVYLGRSGSFRLGRTLASAYSATGGRFERLVLGAARAAGFEPRPPRPSSPAPARPEVDWIARAGIEGVSGSSLAAREIAHQTVAWAAGRAIGCTRCGAILDARKTWLVGAAEVTCDRCHAERAEPLDLGHPSGLAGVSEDDYDA